MLVVCAGWVRNASLFLLVLLAICFRTKEFSRSLSVQRRLNCFSAAALFPNLVKIEEEFIQRAETNASYTSDAHGTQCTHSYSSKVFVSSISIARITNGRSTFRNEKTVCTALFHFIVWYFCFSRRFIFLFIVWYAHTHGANNDGARRTCRHTYTLKSLVILFFVQQTLWSLVRSRVFLLLLIFSFILFLYIFIHEAPEEVWQSSTSISLWRTKKFMNFFLRFPVFFDYTHLHGVHSTADHVFVDNILLERSLIHMWHENRTLIEVSCTLRFVEEIILQNFLYRFHLPTKNNKFLPGQELLAPRQQDISEIDISTR